MGSNIDNKAHLSFILRKGNFFTKKIFKMEFVKIHCKCNAVSGVLFLKISSVVKYTVLQNGILVRNQRNERMNVYNSMSVTITNEKIFVN